MSAESLLRLSQWMVLMSDMVQEPRDEAIPGKVAPESVEFSPFPQVSALYSLRNCGALYTFDVPSLASWISRAVYVDS